MSNYGVFSAPYFPAFGLNTRKYGAEKTPYLDTFHEVKTTNDSTIAIIHVKLNLQPVKRNHGMFTWKVALFFCINCNIKAAVEKKLLN